jgi:hypothetical protein
MIRKRYLNKSMNSWNNRLHLGPTEEPEISMLGNSQILRTNTGSSSFIYSLLQSFACSLEVTWDHMTTTKT